MKLRQFVGVVFAVGCLATIGAADNTDNKCPSSVGGLEPS